MSSLPLLSMKLKVLKIGMLAGSSTSTPDNDITVEEESDRKEFDRAFKTFSYSTGQTPFEKARIGWAEEHGTEFYSWEYRGTLAKRILRFLDTFQRDLSTQARKLYKKKDDENESEEEVQPPNYIYRGNFQIPALGLAMFEYVLSKRMVRIEQSEQADTTLLIYMFECLRLVTKHYATPIVLWKEDIFNFLGPSESGLSYYSRESLYVRLDEIEQKILRIPALGGSVNLAKWYPFSKLLNTPMDLLCFLVSNAVKIEDGTTIRMTPKEKDDFFKVEVRFGEVHPWFFDTTEPKNLRVEEAFYLLMSLREFAEECEQGVAALAVFDYFYKLNIKPVVRTFGPLQKDLHGAQEAAYERFDNLFFIHIHTQKNF